MNSKKWRDVSSFRVSSANQTWGQFTTLYNHFIVYPDDYSILVGEIVRDVRWRHSRGWSSVFQFRLKRRNLRGVTWERTSWNGLNTSFRNLSFEFRLVGSRYPCHRLPYYCRYYLVREETSLEEISTSTSATWQTLVNRRFIVEFHQLESYITQLKASWSFLYSCQKHQEIVKRFKNAIYFLRDDHSPFLLTSHKINQRESLVNAPRHHSKIGSLHGRSQWAGLRRICKAKKKR